MLRTAVVMVKGEQMYQKKDVGCTVGLFSEKRKPVRDVVIRLSLFSNVFLTPDHKQTKDLKLNLLHVIID